MPARRPVELTIPVFRRFGQATALVTLLVMPLAVPAAITSGLTHHWNFDEGPDWHDAPFGSVATISTALDLAGGWNATLVNLAGRNWVSGHEFTCVQFPGGSAWLSVGQNLVSELGSTASLTFWLRTTQTGGTSEWSAPGIAGAADEAHVNGIQWGWLDTNGCLNLSADGALLGRTAKPVNDGQWHFIALARDAASGVGQVYLDGALNDTRSGPASRRTLAFHSLGRIESPSGSASVFAGRLDQVSVFNRVITSEEAMALKTNCAPKVWDAFTEGVNSRPFITKSIFARAYDVENDRLAVRNWTQPAHGSATHNGDGSFTYTPTGGYIGRDSFAVVVEDGQGGCRRAIMNVTVMNEPPGGGGVPITQFTNFVALQASGTPISLSGLRVPRVIDWNGEGKLDLLVGAGGYIWHFLNNGTARAPSFSRGVRVQAAGVDIYSGDGISPMALADMTGDGVPDLVLSDVSNKLRVYRNTSGLGQVPVYAAPVFVATTNGTDLVLPDRRFDIGDWDKDGHPDLATGCSSGSLRLFLNAGTATTPRFGASQAIFSESYNIYPRIFDLNGNGLADLIRGINWGDIRYWRDAASTGLSSSMIFSISNPNGSIPDLHSLTDGAIVDFGDFNGDGNLDLIIGGHAGDNLYSV